MNRTTIDFGIDLGTTNSAVAVFTGNHGEPTKVIKNTTDGNDADITPSAVYINKKGALRVGRRAKDRIVDEDEDVHIEFKRQMGTDHVYSFKSSGENRKPEDLSAEVLKSLRADVQQRTGEVVEASVITVPAAFELHQCDATRKAAQLAGFKESPLLQEPVAAALAYGFQVDQEKTYWLVYDFGGGTFDAAIIKSEEGTIHVAHHGGDNFLGGSNIDWAIVEKLIAPRVIKDFGLTDFTRGNKKWGRAFAKLKRVAEIAKIDLSRNERATLETCKFADDNGEEIEFECDLTRDEVVKIELRHKSASVEFLKGDFDNEMKRFREVKAKASGAAAGTAQELLDEVEQSPLLRRVKELLPAAEGDANASLECEKRLLELKPKLDEAADALEWPALVAESRDWLGYLQKVADQHGNSQQKQKADDLASEVEEIIRDHKPDRLRKKIEQIARLYHEIVMSQPGWWVYQFQKMEEQQEGMSDQAKAGRLLGQGRDCLAKNNATGLQNVVRQLWDLLPDETVQEAKRGYGATIMRR